MINFAAYFMVHFIINLRLFVAMMGSLKSLKICTMKYAAKLIIYFELPKFFRNCTSDRFPISP